MSHWYRNKVTLVAGSSAVIIAAGFIMYLCSDYHACNVAIDHYRKKDYVGAATRLDKLPPSYQKLEKVIYVKNSCRYGMAAESFGARRYAEALELIKPIPDTFHDHAEVEVLRRKIADRQAEAEMRKQLATADEFFLSKQYDEALGALKLIPGTLQDHPDVEALRQLIVGRQAQADKNKLLAEEKDRTRKEETEVEAKRQQEVAATRDRKIKAETPDWNVRYADLKTQFLSQFQAPNIGVHISLNIKGGTAIKGTITALSATEIQIKTGTATIALTQDQLDTDSRNRCFAADFASYNAFQQTKQERDAAESRERAKQAALEAKQRTDQAARLASERKKRIESGFSLWNGAHNRLERVIKKSMNDPASYKHDKTVYQDCGDYLIVTTSFRGKNAFGGVVLNWVKAKCDLDGDVIAVIDQGP